MRGRLGPPPPAEGLVAVVATVKGSAAEVSAFLNGNVRVGADHVFLFVDDASPAALGVADSHPCVTTFATDDAFWGRQGRPTSLNRRQGINANLANVLACTVPRIRWLFPLDLDERLCVDRDRLLALPDTVPVVALRTWEGAASEVEDVRGLYKPWPTVREMRRLHRAGAIDSPDLFHYFRGHHGKRGLRPDIDKRVEMHRVRGPDRQPVKPYAAPWLLVLHDESVTFAQFCRKWEALLTSGGVGQGPARRDLAERLRAVFDDCSIGGGERERRLRELYREQVDDLAALRTLNLLVPAPVREHVPLPLAKHERAVLDAVSDLLRPRSKEAFTAGFPASRERLERLARRCADDPTRALACAGLREALGETRQADHPSLDSERSRTHF